MLNCIKTISLFCDHLWLFLTFKYNKFTLRLLTVPGSKYDSVAGLVGHTCGILLAVGGVGVPGAAAAAGPPGGKKGYPWLEEQQGK